MTPSPDRKRFPIHPCDRKKIASVPWSFVADHEAQAQHNHSQSLTRLAERGGLSLCELLAVRTDRDYYAVPAYDREHAEEIIRTMLADHEEA